MGWVEASESTMSPVAKEWGTECVSCPHMFQTVEDHAIAWDAAGNPHLAYGGDQLYHAWHDGTNWQTEVVDATPQVGAVAALDIDSQNRPHIVYFDQSHYDLKYAQWNGATWQIQSIVAQVGMWGLGELALVLDGSDQAHIAYSVYDSSNENITYVYHDGTQWVEEIAGQYGRRTPDEFSMAVDDANRVHISFSKFVSTNDFGSLIYTVRENGSWHEQALPAGIKTSGHSLALDAQGHPHISYFVSNNYDGTTVELRYSVWDGSRWSHQSLEKSPEGQGGLGMTSLVLDASGQPHIAYGDPNGPGIEYASFDGTEWSRRTVTLTPGNSAALALDPAGEPLIVYLESSDGVLHALRAARWTGRGWTAELIDQAGRAGDNNVLALDSTDRPHILYQENYSVLTYARFNGQAWERQVVDQVNSAARSSSLVIDNQGRPHASYVVSQTVVYATFDGSQWNKVVLDQQPQGASYEPWSDIALDSAGRPHVAYTVHDTLHYASFDGTSWNKQSIAATAGQMWGEMSLDLDSLDRPHIGYVIYDSASNQAPLPRYAHWNGTTWTVQRFDMRDNLPVGGISVAVDGQDRPHIAYGGRYARWDGSQWLMEEVLAPKSTLFDWVIPTLALDSQGQAHIGYGGGYVEARYAHRDGQAWVLESVDANVGDLSLAVDNKDEPHLSYEQGGELKYARFTETSSNEGTFRLYMPITIH